jgi:diguanylate cyclase (GGDEF)-like protein
LAHPHDTTLAQRDASDNLRLKRLGELDPVAARAGTLLRERVPDLAALNETHYDKFQVNGEGYLSMFVPLLAQGQNQWVMGVYAPEDELAKKIREGQRESIFLGVVVSLLVVTAAVLIGLIALRPLNKLQRDASEDPLTGLLNRRGFDEIAAKRLASATRHGRPLTAIMIDIDDFKPVNDRYGHAVGDEVLLVIARRIHHGLSEEDLLGRYGGEEFAVILPDASLDQGTRVAERLRELVAAEPVKTSAGPLELSISLGVAQAGSGACAIADLLDRADRGLLQAKREGRNRVVTVAGAAAIRDLRQAPPAAR